MGVASFVGRVLFASIFILSAWQDFSDDGGRATKELAPKFKVFSNHVTTYTGFQVPHFDLTQATYISIGLRAAGGALFVLGSGIGAYLLLIHQAIFTPILYDFYNYEADKREFNQLFSEFTQNLALFGALLFFVGMTNSITRRTHKRKVASKTGASKTKTR